MMWWLRGHQNGDVVVKGPKGGGGRNRVQPPTPRPHQHPHAVCFGRTDLAPREPGGANLARPARPQERFPQGTGAMIPRGAPAGRGSPEV